MQIKIEKVQQKNFEPFNVIIAVESVVDLGNLDDMAHVLKTNGCKEGLALKAAIVNHLASIEWRKS